MRKRVALCAVSLAFAGAGCSNFMPVLPPDVALPMQEILLNAACEMRAGLRSMDFADFKRFEGDNWLIGISVTPRVDTDFYVGGGWTRKSPTNVSSPNRLTNWVFGSGPGLQLDTKGVRSGGITYNIRSKALRNDTSLPCDDSRATFHALTRRLGVGKWLHRTVEASRSPLSIARIDRPSFYSQITVKFTAGGSYTYTFTPGTDFGSLGGYYSVDEQLQINMTKVSPTYAVNTLPSGGEWPVISSRKTGVVSEESAKSRLDSMQLEQTIKNLQIRN